MKPIDDSDSEEEEMDITTEPSQVSPAPTSAQQDEDMEDARGFANRAVTQS